MAEKIAETCKLKSNKDLYNRAFFEQLRGRVKLRELSHIIEKVCNKTWSIKFNRACIDEKVVAKR